MSLSLPLVVFLGLSAGTLWGIFAAVGLATAGLYLLKLRRRRALVPFLPLWESLLVERKASALRSRLQRLFSFLLSLLVVGALVFALGDPRSESESQGGRSVVVLVDVSASMGQMEGDKSRLAIAQERVEEWLLSLGPGDQFLLVELSARPRPIESFSGDRARLTEALKKLQVLDVSSDLEGALRLSRDALRGRPKPEIILVSDGAHEAMEASVADLPPVFFESVAEARTEADANISLTGFSARRYPSARQRFEVLVQIESSDADEAEVELSIHAATKSGGKGPLLDLHRLTLSKEEVFFRSYKDLDHAEEGLIAEVRRIDGKGESFTADNIARTLLSPISPLRVLVVGKANNFLEAALLIDESLVVERVSAGKYPPVGDFDVTIFDGEFPPREGRTGVALYLGAPAEEDANYPLRTKEKLSLFGFDTWKKDSKVFRLIDPYDVQVLSGWSFRPQAEDLVFASSKARPIMVGGTRKEGAFIALGFNPTESDFVLRAVWPLFVLNVLDELSPRERGNTLVGLRTGTLFRASAPIDSGAVTVRGPGESGEEDGEVVALVDEGRVAFFGQKAGFYELVSGDKSSRFSASLLSDAENRLLPQKELSLGGEKTQAVRGMQARADRDPWVLLLLLVAGVSFVEWWSYHRRWTV